MRLFDELTGSGMGKADVFRRHLGKFADLADIETYVREQAATRGFTASVIDRAWKVLSGFGSFGFAKAHGAAFARTTYESAWLKRHHPATFFAGLLTHDPGTWPKDLIVAIARNLGVPILGLDVQPSALDYRVEQLGDGRLGIRLALPELAGSSSVERHRIAEHQPFSSLQDFRDRVRPRRRTFEALARVGALDSLIGYDRGRRGDLLAHIQGLGGRALPVAADQLAFDIELPLPDSDRSATALDLRGISQTDVEHASGNR